MKKTKISRGDFDFCPSGYGHYKVTYRSPNTFKEWRTTTNNMPLIDAVYHNESPKVCDLEFLKYICKRDGSVYRYDSKKREMVRID